MDEYNYEKRGHGGLAILFGILGILVGLFGVFTFGMVPMIVAIVLGALAVILGIVTRAQTHRKGIGGIVWGILAILVAGCMFFALRSLSQMIIDEKDKIPTVAEYAEDIKTKGLVGMVQHMIDDGVDQDLIEKELNSVNPVA